MAECSRLFWWQYLAQVGFMDNNISIRGTILEQSLNNHSVICVIPIDAELERAGSVTGDHYQGDQILGDAAWNYPRRFST